MNEKILILDFGSQYTQLIARAVREANVFCEIIPFNKSFEYEPGLKGIILSGSPFSVNDVNAPDVNVQFMISRVPVLGVCYGAQLTAKQFGGRVEKSNKREYGRALLHKLKEDVMLKGVMEHSQVWMSHADTILELPPGFELLATTESIPVAAFKKSRVGSQESVARTHDSRLTTFLFMVCSSIPKFTTALKEKRYCRISS
jgi:GMP synthase (glutamine-hydrolysing)